MIVHAPSSAPSGTLQATHRWVSLLGLFNAVVLAAYAILSYGLAAATPDGAIQSESQTNLAATLGLGDTARAFLSGQLFETRTAFLAAYGLPVLALTGTFLALLFLLARHRDALTTDVPKTLFRYALAFAAIAALASPVLVQDFWLSVAWGRMAVDGVNPYHADATQDVLRHLPLASTGSRMTYGPLWALISGAVMGLAGEHALLGALFFKLLLAGAWMTVLGMIWTLLRDHPLWHQCVGIALFGWIPLSIFHIPADGHNDIVMVFFLTVWLLDLRRGPSLIGRLALAASVLVKYVTAPLFLLDLLYMIVYRRGHLKRYALELVAAGALIFAVFGLFYRSPDFFEAAASMRGWHFWRPKDAVYALESWLGGIDLWHLPHLVQLLFPLIALLAVVRFWRHPEARTLWQAMLAMMAAVVFSTVGHVWPWFLVWALMPAALVPGTALTRWTLGVALALPFPILFWPPFHTSTLLLYAFAVLWFIGVPRRWFPSPQSPGTNAVAQA